MNKDSKMHIIAVSSIAALVLGSIWLFGLDDNIQRVLIPQNDGAVQNYNLISNTDSIQSKNNDKDYPDQNNADLTSKYLMQNNETAVEEKKPSSDTFEQEKISYNDQKEEKISKISLLENSEFTLKGIGTAYQGVSSMSKKAMMTLQLKPVKGKELKEFQIKEGRLQIGINIIKMDEGFVRIKENNITIELTQNDASDSVSTMNGSIDETVWDDNDGKQKIHFEKQDLYLSKEEVRPFKITIDAILSHV